MKWLILCFILPFSLLGMGRPFGMASTYISIADDVNAIFYNPAGIAQIKENELCWTKLLNNRDSIELDLKENIAFCNMIGEKGFGASYISLLNIDDYLDLNYNGKRDDNEPYLGYKDNIAIFTTASYGENLLKNVAFGINLKGYSKTLVKGHISKFTEIGKKKRGISIDIGMLYHLSKEVSFGATIYDLNEPEFEYSDLKIDDNIYDRKIKHPMTFCSSISLKPDNKTIIGMDIYGLNRINDWYSKEKDKSAQTSVRIGFEREILPSLVVRGGYGGGFHTIGFGIKTRNIRLDYAIMEKNGIGFHILSFVARWQSGLMRWS